MNWHAVKLALIVTAICLGQPARAQWSGTTDIWNTSNGKVGIGTGAAPSWHFQVEQANGAMCSAGANTFTWLFDKRRPSGSPSSTLNVWPNGSEFGLVVSDVVPANSCTSASSSAPATIGALMAVIESQDTTADAVGALGYGLSTANGATVFGANFIAYNAPGVSSRLVGAEIDVGPSSTGSASAGSGGLFINAFNGAIPGPAIQLGGVSSGTFQNGIIISHIASNGTGYAVESSSPAMDSAINVSTGTYNTAAIVAGNQSTNNWSIHSTGPNLFRSNPNADETIVVDTQNTGYNAQVIFRSGGTDKWYLRKNVSDELDIVNGSGSRVAVVYSGGDVHLPTAGKGLILKSPDGLTCARISINNTGNVISTVLTCP
jgi:hypothetical protein